MAETPLHDIDLLVHGGTVVTMDDDWTLIEDGAVAVDGHDIVAVGGSSDLRARFAARQNVDAAGHVVMPGLINGHTHAAMTLFRGMADDLALEVWLSQHIWPAEGAFVNPQSVHWGTALACVEMIRGGVTSALDMYWFPEVCAESARRVGLRFVLGGVMVDFPGADGLVPAQRLAENRALLQKYAADPLIGRSIQPHATYTVSPDLLVAAKALADEFGVLFGTHASETEAEVADVRARYGRTPAQHLDALGLLGPRTAIFHGVHFEDEEIALLAERDTAVVHCLESELKLASGIPRTPELLKAGVRVGLGTDGSASNNDLDMWAELRLAAQLFKARYKDPTVIPAREAVRMATRGSASALGMADRVGQLAPGKRADIILIDFDQPHLTPLYDVYSHLAYAVNKADVTTTIVNGQVVMQGRQIVTVDEREIVAHVREIAAAIRADRRG